jgi:hypothetical protein
MLTDKRFFFHVKSYVIEEFFVTSFNMRASLILAKEKLFVFPAFSYKNVNRETKIISQKLIWKRI